MKYRKLVPHSQTPSEGCLADDYTASVLGVQYHNVHYTGILCINTIGGGGEWGLKGCGLEYRNF